jgi:hypothetical protein
VIIVVLAAGHLLMHLDSCAVFLLYPIWEVALAYLLVDSLYRLAHAPAGLLCIPIGIAVGVGIGWLTLVIYDLGGLHIVVGLVTGFFGMLGGLMVFVSEGVGLRDY